jgi:choline dehydrogenase
VRQPDLQLTFMPLAIKPGTVEDVGAHSFQVHIDLMRPKSLGQVTIRSADPAAAPSICFNYLSDPQDVRDLRTSVRLTREILAQSALEPYRGEELSPGNGIQSDADIDAWVRRGVETCYHPVGTCRMGLDSRSAVVDAECRVHGVAGLRVVDASIMPAIVSGNTNAPTIMIAEKMSDMLRGRPGLPREAPAVWEHPRWATQQRWYRRSKIHDCRLYANRRHTQGRRIRGCFRRRRARDGSSSCASRPRGGVSLVHAAQHA